MGLVGEASKESVHSTAEREMVMADQQKPLEDAVQKVLFVTYSSSNWIQNNIR